MDIYFEKLTFWNFVQATIANLKGHRVYYYNASFFINKILNLAGFLLVRFERADTRLVNFQGLALEIHDKCLEFAERCGQPIIEENRFTITLWSKAFNSDQMPLYIKKSLAYRSWEPIRNYLILLNKIGLRDTPIQLVVTGNGLNRLLSPFLLQQYPDSGVQIKGLSRFPSRIIGNVFNMIPSVLELFARSLWRVLKGGITLHTHRRQFRVCKEIVWGIGTGRRSDDFLVDGRLIRPEDMLFYYRRSSHLRMAYPDELNFSLANAREKGYECVMVDETPITLALLCRGFLYRYLVLPLAILFVSSGTQIFKPSAVFLNEIIMLFLMRTMRWEVFLATYAPSLHLGQGEPHPGHIADTVGQNIHGCEGGGFQWADMTQWRGIYSSYVGFNVYFAWGPLAEKFWEGNWSVGRIVQTGYIFGHLFQESQTKQKESAIDLLGNAHANQRVIALFDEKSSPNWLLSEENVYDFYRIGVELLDKRSDIVVVAKPKTFSGLTTSPEILTLIEPYVKSGRFKLWTEGSVDIWQVMSIADIVVSMGMGVPYLEAACCGRIGFNFAPLNFYSSGVYPRGYGKVVFGDVPTMIDAITSALDQPNRNPWTDLSDLLNQVDPYRDFRGINRMRAHIHDSTTAGLQSNLTENILGDGKS